MTALCVQQIEYGLMLGMVAFHITVLKNKADCNVADDLDREQRDELRNLKEDKSLVIQSADKGGAIVIMDQTQYDQEIKKPTCQHSVL